MYLDVAVIQTGQMRILSCTCYIPSDEFEWLLKYRLTRKTRSPTNEGLKIKVSIRTSRLILINYPSGHMTLNDVV